MDAKTLNTKTIKELKNIANERNIKLVGNTLKDDIVKTIVKDIKKQQRAANKTVKATTSSKDTNTSEIVKTKTRTSTAKTQTAKTQTAKTQTAKTPNAKTSTAKTPNAKTQDNQKINKSADNVKKQPKQQYAKTSDGKFSILQQLGQTGKEGTTFLVKNRKGDEYAMKTFPKQKSTNNIQKEASYQKHVATFGLAPKIKDVSETERYIIMDRLDRNLFDIVKKHNGNIPDAIQKKIVNIICKMDETGVFHGDPNPANFMLKGNDMYMIDYGFARDIDEKLMKRYDTNTPNKKFMILGLILKLKEIYREHNPNIEYKVLSKVLSK